MGGGEGKKRKKKEKFKFPGSNAAADIVSQIRSN